MKKIVAAIALAFLSMSAVHGKEGMSQQEKMKYCNVEAKEKSLKGDERRAFMKSCLSKKKDVENTSADMKSGEGKPASKTGGAS